MPSVYARIPKTQIKFYLSDRNISSSLEKKFFSTGFPEVWITFSTDKNLKVDKLPNNFYIYKSGEFGETFPIIGPTSQGFYGVEFNSSEKSFIMTFDGEFLVWGDTDQESARYLSTVKQGFIGGAKLNDSAGRLLKYPKDENGFSFPVEVIVSKDSIDFLQKINFELFVK